MNKLIVAFSIIGCLAGCAATAPAVRPVAPTDMVFFGTLPAVETVLRVKMSCSVPSPGGWSHILAVGDYEPKAVDSHGTFYAAPQGVTYQRGAETTPQMDGGVHLPNIPYGQGRQYSYFYSWVAVYHVDLKRTAYDKKPLPARCWQPYGSTMAIVHKGVEIPLH